MSKRPTHQRSVEFSLSPEMIEQVLCEWEAEHPGRNVFEMGEDEFTDRMMVKIGSSGRVILDG